MKFSIERKVEPVHKFGSFHPIDLDVGEESYYIDDKKVPPGSYLWQIIGVGLAVLADQYHQETERMRKEEG